MENNLRTTVLRTYGPSFEERPWTSRQYGHSGLAYTLTTTPQGMLQAAAQVTALLDAGRIPPLSLFLLDDDERTVAKRTRQACADMAAKMVRLAYIGLAAKSLADRLDFHGSLGSARDLHVPGFQPQLEPFDAGDSWKAQLKYATNAAGNVTEPAAELGWLAVHEMIALSERFMGDGTSKRYVNEVVSLQPAFTGYAMCSIVRSYRSDAPSTHTEAHAFADESDRTGRTNDWGNATRNARTAQQERWEAAVLYAVAVAMRLPTEQRDAQVDASSALRQAAELADMKAWGGDPTSLIDPDLASDR